MILGMTKLDQLQNSTRLHSIDWLIDLFIIAYEYSNVSSSRLYNRLYKCLQPIVRLVVQRVVKCIRTFTDRITGTQRIDAACCYCVV